MQERVLDCIQLYNQIWGFPGGASGEEPAFQWRRDKRHGFNPWVREIHWRRAWQPTAEFLPGELHGQGSMMGYSPWGRKEMDMTDEEYTHTQDFTVPFYVRIQDSSEFGIHWDPGINPPWILQGNCGCLVIAKWYMGSWTILGLDWDVHRAESTWIHEKLFDVMTRFWKISVVALYCIVSA